MNLARRPQRRPQDFARKIRQLRDIGRSAPASSRLKKAPAPVCWGMRNAGALNTGEDGRLIISNDWFKFKRPLEKVNSAALD